MKTSLTSYKGSLSCYVSKKAINLHRRRSITRICGEVPRREIQHTFGNRCPNYRMVRTATDITYYLFVPQATDYSAEYESGWEITDIFFHNSSVGIATARDRLTIHRTAEDVARNGN